MLTKIERRLFCAGMRKKLRLIIKNHVFDQEVTPFTILFLNDILLNINFVKLYIWFELYMLIVFFVLSFAPFTRIYPPIERSWIISNLLTVYYYISGGMLNIEHI